MAARRNIWARATFPSSRSPFLAEDQPKLHIIMEYEDNSTQDKVIHRNRRQKTAYDIYNKKKKVDRNMLPQNKTNMPSSSPCHLQQPQAHFGRRHSTTRASTRRNLLLLWHVMLGSRGYHCCLGHFHTYHGVADRTAVADTGTDADASCGLRTAVAG